MEVLQLWLCSKVALSYRHYCCQKMKRKIMELLRNKVMFILIQMINSKHFLDFKKNLLWKKFKSETEKLILTGHWLFSCHLCCPIFLLLNILYWVWYWEKVKTSPSHPLCNVKLFWSCVTLKHCLCEMCFPPPPRADYARHPNIILPTEIFSQSTVGQRGQI